MKTKTILTVQRPYFYYDWSSGLPVKTVRHEVTDLTFKGTKDKAVHQYVIYCSGRIGDIQSVKEQTVYTKLDRLIFWIKNKVK